MASMPRHHRAVPWRELDARRAYLREEHERVPSLDFHGDHEVLGEDERGEGDADHVNEALLEEEDAAEHDDAALVEGLPRPHEEGLEREVAAHLQLAVELRELEGVHFRDVLVEHEREDGAGGEEGGVAEHEHAWFG